MQTPTLEHDSGTWLPPMASAPQRPSPAPAPRRRRRSPWHAIAVAVCVGVPLVLAGAIPVLLALQWVTVRAGSTVTDLPPLPETLEASPERSILVDRDGRELAVLQIENRVSAELDEIPGTVIDAVVATEDQSFWDHGGVNWTAIVRAAFRNASAGEITGGGSTITQQLVKNRVVGTEQSLQRKVGEAVYARQLEERSSKEEILELYLNDTYFGNGVYGVATAAEFYWNKPVGELTLADAATLAGMIRAPEKNDPIDHPDRALERRGIVLDQMVELGMVSSDEARAADAAPLALDVTPQEPSRSPFLVDVVQRELERQPALGATPQERWNAVLEGGLRIRTTFDARLQRIAERTIRDLLDGGADDPLASIVAVEPSTGETLAVAVGPREYGIEPGQTTINPAVPGLGGTGRQPGSTFKAFQLVAALEEGVSVGHTFHSQAAYETPGCPDYEVTNYGQADLGVQNMRAATATSSNTYFLHLMDEAGGPEKLAETASRMGIDTELSPYCSLVLGGTEVYPSEMASAFGTLAAGGTHCERHAIEAIFDGDGETLHRADPGCDEVVDADVAAQATDLLRAPVEEGTASEHGQIGRPAAGKTGTTTDGRDAWFAGYIPQLAVTTWVGHEIPEKLVHPLCGEVTGGCLPTMLWRDFMVEAVDVLELPVEDFPTPPPPPMSTVPDVVGLAEADAVTAVLDAGFLPETAVVRHHEPAGTVVGQDPGGGQDAPEGSSVGLSVSDGMGFPDPDLLPETATSVMPDEDEPGDGREWLRELLGRRGDRPPDGPGPPD